VFAAARTLIGTAIRSDVFKVLANI